jgi:hypothetical protein
MHAFKVNVATEARQETPGIEHVFTISGSVVFRRPNQIAVLPSSVVMTLNGRPQELKDRRDAISGTVCDGKTVTVLSLDGEVREARPLGEEEARFVEPLPELATNTPGGFMLALLVSPDPLARLSQGELRCLGAEEFAGVRCHKVEWAGDTKPDPVFWIECGPTPLIRRVIVPATDAATRTLDDGVQVECGAMPEMAESYSNWEVDPEVDAGVFQVPVQRAGGGDSAEGGKAVTERR